MFNGQGRTVTLPSLNDKIEPGQRVTGAGLPPDTAVAAYVVVNNKASVELTRAIGTQLAESELEFEPSTSTIHLLQSDPKIQVGQYVSVAGKTAIPTNTTVVSISGGVLGISSTLTADVLLTDAVTFTTTTLELESSAEEAGVVAGQRFELTDGPLPAALHPGTYVEAVDGATITLSHPLAADIAGGSALIFTANSGDLTFTAVSLSLPTIAKIARGDPVYVDPHETVVKLTAFDDFVPGQHVRGKGVDPATTVKKVVSWGGMFKIKSETSYLV